LIAMALTRRTTPTPSEPLTPALIYLLVMGRTCPDRVRDWVALAIDQRSPETIRRALWPTVGAQIVAETAPYGFEPWGDTGRRPTGAGVEAWVRQFLATHWY
jgi:hypothetical protein